ncbi:hypothetical protein RB195_005938 [Necator americanus]|uniref:Uncharacterized protein n=1 Tax=Necator americanus TaxID=51031 RepID=A0ABR1BQB7_NECAM
MSFNDCVLSLQWEQYNNNNSSQQLRNTDLQLQLEIHTTSSFINRTFDVPWRKMKEDKPRRHLRLQVLCMQAPKQKSVRRVLSQGSLPITT